MSIDLKKKQGAIDVIFSTIFNFRSSWCWIVFGSRPVNESDLDSDLDLYFYNKK